MLVMLDSFDDFFAILCSVIRKGTSEKKKLSYDDRGIGGIRGSCLDSENPRAAPPLTRG